jgi:hypothetical protein
MPTSRTVAKKDENRVPTLIGVSSETTTINGVVFTEGVTPVPVAVDPITGAIILEEE